MSQRFPIFCYTFARSCPEPDTMISLKDVIESPPEITQLLNRYEKQVRKELKSLGGPGKLPKVRSSEKRPSIECRILSFK
jgi:hypothetical protein